MAQRNSNDRNTDDMGGEMSEDAFDEIVDAGLAPGTSTGALSQSEAETQRDEFRAQLQRAQADYQNLRRRLQSDIDTAVARSKGPLLQDLLLVLDYLDLALAVPTTSAESKNLHAGVEMTKGQLVRALDREGISPCPRPARSTPRCTTRSRASRRTTPSRTRSSRRSARATRRTAPCCGPRR